MLFLPWPCGFWVTFIFPLSADICEFSPARDCFIIRRKVILKKQKLYPNIPAAGTANRSVPGSVSKGASILVGMGGLITAGS